MTSFHIFWQFFSFFSIQGYKVRAKCKKSHGVNVWHKILLMSTSSLKVKNVIIFHMWHEKSITLKKKHHIKFITFGTCFEKQCIRDIIYFHLYNAEKQYKFILISSKSFTFENEVINSSLFRPLWVLSVPRFHHCSRPRFKVHQGSRSTMVQDPLYFHTSSCFQTQSWI